jgi:hypothetical protein
MKREGKSVMSVVGSAVVAVLMGCSSGSDKTTKGDAGGSPTDGPVAQDGSGGGTTPDARGDGTTSTPMDATASDGAATGGAPGSVTFEATIDGVSTSLSCTLKTGTAVFDKDAYVAGVAGNRINVACPGVAGTAVENPSILVSFLDIRALPASFNWGLTELAQFEIQADTGPAQTRSFMLSDNFMVRPGVTAVALQGTWDSTTRRLKGSLSGTREGAPATGGIWANGTITATFDVNVP